MEVGGSGVWVQEPPGALPQFLHPSVSLNGSPQDREVGSAGGSMAEFSSKSSAQNLTCGEY